jgi:hypothetical protein
MVRDASQNATLLTKRVLQLAASKVLILRSPPQAGVSKDGRVEHVAATPFAISPQ